ncbi:MAG: hypothetical protein ACRD3W_14985, partial [Terriglobales bacterium]
VGVAPFLTVFQSLEAMVPGGDEATISTTAKRLSDSIAEQEQKLKAKDKPATTAAAPADNLPLAPPVTGKKPNRQVLASLIQQQVLDDSYILINPEAYIKALQDKITAGGRRAEDYPQWALALRYFAITLREGNKIPEAQQVERRLYQIRTKHPNF